MIERFEASPETFDTLVREPAGELVIVYFRGDRCPNCEVFAEQLPTLLEELGDVSARLVKVDAYEHPELGTSQGIFGIPQFHLWLDGTRLGKMSQFHSRAYWLAVIREHLP